VYVDDNRALQLCVAGLSISPTADKTIANVNPSELHRLPVRVAQVLL